MRAKHPAIGVVVLSQYAEAAYALQLLHAVREVKAGGSVIDPDVVSTLVAHGSGRTASALGELTDRERDVLHQMAQGRTNAGIAGALHLSESSVEKYSGSIFAKLHLSDEPQVHRRVAAVLTYLRDARRADPI